MQMHSSLFMKKTGITILYYAELIAISKYIKEKYKGNFFAL